MMQKTTIAAVVGACMLVGMLGAIHISMTHRHQGLSDRVRTEAARIKIPEGARYTNITVITSTPGVWYVGKGEIHVCGTVPSVADMEELRGTIQKVPVAFPISWEVRLDGQESWVAFAREEMQQKQRRDQLWGMVLPRLLMFWGLSPLLFPAILIGLYSVLPNAAARRGLDAGILAWGLWVMVFGFLGHRYFSWFSLLPIFSTVVPVAVVWFLVTKAHARNQDRRMLRLLAPCTIPVVMDAVYSPLNAGVLVQRFGCGCRLEGMNTNHITLAVFVAAWIATLISTGIVSRHEQQKTRLIHLVAVGGFTFWLARQVMLGNMWL